MVDARWTQLRRILVDSGWVWRDDTLYAPHETMWFTVSSDQPNFAQFRDRMTEAANATDGDHSDVDQVALHADLVSLVAALDAVLDGN
jgi:hypothetical protein